MNVAITHGHLELRASSHPDAGTVTVSFQRTLRIPDDGRAYPLPPGLGEFPLRLVGDYKHRLPAAIWRRGGVLLPMYQREAMWLSFGGRPHALKVGIGKVCAISGEAWRDGLREHPQNYVVTGTQPWLDGIASGKGTIRQFVAMPLGKGLTVEAQLTGKEEHGGIQLQAFSPKPGRIPRSESCLGMAMDDCCFDLEESCASPAMGLGAGGTMEQKVYPDPYGVGTWDEGSSARVFVHIVNSEMWQQITGEPPPPSPVSARSYIDAGLPWYSLYDEGAKTITPTSQLAGVKSMKQIEQNKLVVKKLPWKPGAKLVDDGEW
jgi:hypothetical protein